MTGFKWVHFIENEKYQKIFIFIIAFVFGPLLTLLLTNSPHWTIATRLRLAEVVHISSLYIVFTFYHHLFHFLLKKVMRLDDQPRFFVEFLKFFVSLLTADRYQDIFVYEPLFHYPRSHDPSIILITTALYSAGAAAVFYRFIQMRAFTLKSKVAQTEAQYNVLESQMQPHFLFNSLNVLSELIYMDQDMASSMIHKMADLYRDILNNSKARFSSLESEISILKKYIELQKIRFSHRLRFHVDISPAFFNLQIPSLILQTLVENAIKHGISPKKEGGEIFLEVTKKDTLFKICVSNTGHLYKEHEKSKGGTGLQNTKNRLNLIYGPKHSFKIYSDNTRTHVEFLITGRKS